MTKWGRVCPLLMVLLLSVTISLVHASTSIPANTIISETTQWRLADGPFYLQGDLTISPVGLLQIEQGIEIFLEANARITVRGTLRAIGSAEFPVW